MVYQTNGFCLNRFLMNYCLTFYYQMLPLCAKWTNITGPKVRHRSSWHSDAQILHQSNAFSIEGTHSIMLMQNDFKFTSIFSCEITFYWSRNWNVAFSASVDTEFLLVFTQSQIQCQEVARKFVMNSSLLDWPISVGNSIVLNVNQNYTK